MESEEILRREVKQEMQASENDMKSQVETLKKEHEAEIEALRGQMEELQVKKEQISQDTTSADEGPQKVLLLHKSYE